MALSGGVTKNALGNGWGIRPSPGADLTKKKDPTLKRW